MHRKDFLQQMSDLGFDEAQALAEKDRLSQEWGSASFAEVVRFLQTDWDPEKASQVLNQVSARGDDYPRHANELPSVPGVAGAKDTKYYSSGAYALHRPTERRVMKRGN